MSKDPSLPSSAPADASAVDLVSDPGSAAGADLFAQVRQAQELLGGGESGEALRRIEPLLGATAEAVRAPSFLGRRGPDREALLDAFCYARVTAVLALESLGAASAAPRIRQLAAEAVDIAGPAAWRVACAAAEMLARCGDGPGAADLVGIASRLAPDEAYVGQVRAALRSMFPAAF
jgi:hypothetical protein